MSNIPPLNYFMEQEEAHAAMKTFSLILQEAFKEYKKIWNMYINLVKKCEENNSTSFSKDKSDARQKSRNYEYTKNMRIDEQDMTNSILSIEDVLEECTLNLNSSMEESNEGDISEKIRKDVVPRSPIFQRSNSKRSNSMGGSSKSIVADDNLGDDNEQENIDRVHSVTNASSTTNVSSIFLCSTPTRSQKWNKSKKQSIKRSTRSKKTTPSSSLKKKNNLISIRKEKTNKVPLQIINNVASVSKNIYQICKNNSNKPNNIEVTMSPSSRKLKQTKLVFHKDKKTMELSNNLQSLDVSQMTKANNPIHDQEIILKQNTITNSIDLKGKGTNDKHIGNTYNQVEVNKDATENNFVFIHTNAQIKNEVILQEYELTNRKEINDPLNTSNELDSTFSEETECSTHSNKINVTNIDSDKTYESMKNETKSTNENIIAINDVEEPIQKKRLSKLEKEKCNECKRNGKKYCPHHRSTFYKRRSLPSSSSTLLPDSPSSTT